MASIRFRNNKWQARVIRKGITPISRTFLTKLDAERWARKIETDIDRNSYVNTTLAEKTTLREIIQKYIKEVTPSKKSSSSDSYKLNAICRRPICNLSMLALNPKEFAKYRDDRLTEVSSGTVIMELNYFSCIINHARREWGINIPNPLTLVKKPTIPKGRTRILSDSEKVRLLEALESTWKNRRNVLMKPLVEFALETAMRRGEIISLLWKNVDTNKQVAFLPSTKNGESRYVPLSTKAIDILNNLTSKNEEKVFPINHFCVATIFIRAIKRANIEDFHFHDLRHTAITNMAGKIPNILELSAISGHKTLSMLKRYTHFNAEDLAKKLG